MASGGEIIKEFVVSIKYRVDDSELQKTNQKLSSGFGSFGGNVKDGLSKLDDFIGGMLAGSVGEFVAWAAGISAAAAGVVKIVDTVTDHFTDLYYAQQKISNLFNASGANMLVLEQMGKLTGVGEDTIISMLEHVAQGMRDLPKGSLLAPLIGGEKDPEKAIEKLIKFYGTLSDSKPDQFYKRQIEKFLNIDPDMMRQLSQNIGDVAQYLQIAKDAISGVGLNPDELERQSVQFNRNIATLDFLLQIFTDKAVSELLPSLNEALKELTKWIVAHEKDIEHTLDQLPDAMETLFGWLQDLIDVITTVHKYMPDLSFLNPLKDAGKGFNVGKALGDAVGKALGAIPTQTNTATTTPEAPSAKNRYGYDINPGGVNQQPNIDTGAAPAPATGDNTPVNIHTDIHVPPAPAAKPISVTRPVPKTPAPFGAAGEWLYSNVWQPFSRWVTEKTKSPFVEIWDAKSFWALAISWLSGSASRVPLVQLQKDQESKDQNIIDQITALAQQLNSQGGGTTGGAGNGQIQNPDAVTPSGPKITSDQEKKNLLEGVNFFENKGLSEQQAIGLVSRLFAESNLDPNAVNPTSGAYGIAQWLGSRKNAALATRGDFNKQLQLVWDELNSTEKTAFAAIKAAKTAPQAANATELYERANDPKFTAHADALAAFFSKQLLDKLSILTDNATRANAQLSKPPVGVAPVPAAGGRDIHFSPSTTIHVTARGAEMGAVVFNAASRAHSTLYRNYYSKLS